MKLKAALDQFIQFTIALLMGLMVLNVTWQVVSRYLLGDPSSFTDELARYSMIWKRYRVKTSFIYSFSSTAWLFFLGL